MPDDINVNVTLVITNVGADYTSLGSFGDPETFGANLVSSMDRSFTLRSPFNKKRPEEVQVAQTLPPPLHVDDKMHHVHQGNDKMQSFSTGNDKMHQVRKGNDKVHSNPTGE